MRGKKEQVWRITRKLGRRAEQVWMMGRKATSGAKPHRKTTPKLRRQAKPLQRPAVKMEPLWRPIAKKGPVEPGTIIFDSSIIFDWSLLSTSDCCSSAGTGTGNCWSNGRQLQLRN